MKLAREDEAACANKDKNIGEEIFHQQEANIVDCLTEEELSQNLEYFSSKDSGIENGISLRNQLENDEKLAKELESKEIEKLDELYASSLVEQNTCPAYHGYNLRDRPINQDYNRINRVLDHALYRGHPIRHREHRGNREGPYAEDATYEELLELDAHQYDKGNGVNSEELWAIPTSKFESKFNKDQSNCSICQEDFKENENVTRLPCLHIFHPSCCEEWLERKNACPICKIPAISKSN